jgi:hypothetical protein
VQVDVDELDSVDSGDDTILTRADMDSRNRDPRASRKSLSAQKGAPKGGKQKDDEKRLGRVASLAIFDSRSARTRTGESTC